MINLRRCKPLKQQDALIPTENFEGSLARISSPGARTHIEWSDESYDGYEAVQNMLNRHGITKDKLFRPYPDGQLCPYKGEKVVAKLCYARIWTIYIPSCGKYAFIDEKGLVF